MRELVEAAREMLHRIRERWPGDPVLTHAAKRLDVQVQRMAEGYAGVDAVPSTRKVQEADEYRDAAIRALHHHLRALLYSRAHSDTWKAAKSLLRVMTGDGLAWIHDTYTLQSVRIQEILTRFDSMTREIETCSAGVFVEQLRHAQAVFSQAMQQRAHVVSEKPTPVREVIPDFRRSLQLMLALVEDREAGADRAYVLEPFARLRAHPVRDDARETDAPAP